MCLGEVSSKLYICNECGASFDQINELQVLISLSHFSEYLEFKHFVVGAPPKENSMVKSITRRMQSMLPREQQGVA